MNVEEIKASITMRELVERYGYKVNRASMMRCPFHADKDASLKIYKDSFHCFGCGASGDVFTFTQKALNCDFKTAFIELGGEYNLGKKASKMAEYHADRAKKNRTKKERKKIDREKMIVNDVHRYRELYQAQAEGSDAWWDYYDKYHFALLLLCNMEGGVT